MNRAALLGPQTRISEEARIAAEHLVEPRFDNPLSIGSAEAGIAERAPGDAQSVGGARAWNNARAEIGVVLGARAGAQRQPRQRPPLGIQKTCLIVAPHVEADIAHEAVLDFVLVSRGQSKSMNQIRRLRHKPRAVVLLERGRQANEIEFTAVGFEAAQLVMPVGSGGELGMEIRTKIVQSDVACGVRRHELRLAGSARVTVIVPQSQTYTR